MTNRHSTIALTMAFVALLITFGRAAAETPSPRTPIWFYDRQMDQVVPDIDPRWVTVVFSTGPDGPSTQPVAEAIRERVPVIEDYFFDANLHPDACFFRLREGLLPTAVEAVIDRLETRPEVHYARPTLRIKDRTWAYFDTFDIEWKTGVTQAVKADLARRAGARSDAAGGRWRIDPPRAPLFTGVNLLAEDIRTVYATPSLVEVRPAIQARLELDIAGGGIGDPIPYALTVDFRPERVRIDPSTFTRLPLKPDGIQADLFESTVAPYDPVRVSEKSPIRIEGRMRIYAPGDHRIPPIGIRYTCIACPGEPVRTYATEAVPVRIGSILPPDEHDLTLRVPMTVPEPDFDMDRHRDRMESSRRLAVAFLSLAGGFLIWLLRGLRPAIRKPREPATEPAPSPLSELSARLESAPEPPHWRYMASVAGLLRRTLTDRYALPTAPAGGTGAIFSSRVAGDLPPEIAETVKAILTETDAAAAEERRLHPEIEGFRMRVGRVIDAISRRD